MSDSHLGPQGPEVPGAWEASPIGQAVLAYRKFLGNSLTGHDWSDMEVLAQVLHDVVWIDCLLCRFDEDSLHPIEEDAATWIEGCREQARNLETVAFIAREVWPCSARMMNELVEVLRTAVPDQQPEARDQVYAILRRVRAEQGSHSLYFTFPTELFPEIDAAGTARQREQAWPLSVHARAVEGFREHLGFELGRISSEKSALRLVVDGPIHRFLYHGGASDVEDLRALSRKCREVWPTIANLLEEVALVQETTEPDQPLARKKIGAILKRLIEQRLLQLEMGADEWRDKWITEAMQVAL